MNVSFGLVSVFESATAAMPLWLGWLLYVSLVASVVALVACALQKLACRKVSAGLIYVVWILVCLRFVFVWTPESPTSFLNLIQDNNKPEITESFQSDSNADVVIEGLELGLDIEPVTFDPALYSESFSLPIESANQEEANFSAMRILWFLVGGIWLAGVLFLSFKLLGQAIGIAELVRKSEKVSPELRDLLVEIFDCHGPASDATTRIRISDNVDAPATVGLFRPIVLLPRWCAKELTAKQLELVLVHELIHVRRRDVLIQFLSHLVMTLHWFNPIARFVRNRIEEFREITCDQLVIESCGLGDAEGTRLYAETILHFVDRVAGSAQTVNQPEWIPGFVGGKKNFIRERILMMDQKKSSLARVCGLVCVIGLVLVGFTSAQTSSQTPDVTPATQETVEEPVESVGKHDGITIQLPEISSTAVSRVVSVPDGGVLMSGKAYGRSSAIRPDSEVALSEKNREKESRPSSIMQTFVTPKIQIQEEDEEEQELVDLPLLPNDGKRIWFSENFADKGIGYPGPYTYRGTREVVRSSDGERVVAAKQEKVQPTRLRHGDWPIPFKINEGGALYRLVPKFQPKRKVRFVATTGPVEFDKLQRMIIDGEYTAKDPMVSLGVVQKKKLSELTEELDVVYEFEVFQGRKEAMQRLLAEVIHPNSMKRQPSGEIPRVGMMGLDETSWGNGKKNSEELLRGMLGQPKYDFKRVFKQASRVPDSKASVQLASDEDFSFTGRQFKQGVESEFRKHYSVGTSIQISPMLKGRELSSVIKINNVSLSSVLREHVHPSYHSNGDWQDNPYLQISSALQAITVPVGSRFVVWATGTFQDSSAKKLAEDDALIVLVRPKLIRWVVDTELAKATPGPPMVEGKLKVPMARPIVGATKPDIGVVRASHVDSHVEKAAVANPLPPVELQRRLKATIFRYDVQVYEVHDSELEGLLKDLEENSKDNPYGGLSLGKNQSDAYVKLVKQLSELKHKGKARLLSRPNMTMTKDTSGKIQVGQKYPVEKGRIENGILVKEKIEDLQIGLEITIRPRVDPKTGMLISQIDSKFTGVDPTRETLLAVESDSNGVKYEKHPAIIESEYNTTLLSKPGETTVLKSVPLTRNDGEKRTELLLITPRIIDHQKK